MPARKLAVKLPLGKHHSRSDCVPFPTDDDRKDTVRLATRPTGNLTTATGSSELDREKTPATDNPENLRRARSDHERQGATDHEVHQGQPMPNMWRLRR